MLGGQATLPAGGLAVVVAISAVELAAMALVVSWKQRSFVVTCLTVSNTCVIRTIIIESGQKGCNLELNPVQNIHNINSVNSI